MSRLVVTMAEPEWDQATRDLALARDFADALLCPHCGQEKSVCQDPARQTDWRVGLPIRCHAYTESLKAQEKAREDDGIENDSALLWPAPRLVGEIEDLDRRDEGADRG